MIKPVVLECYGITRRYCLQCLAGKTYTHTYTQTHTHTHVLVQEKMLSSLQRNSTQSHCYQVLITGMTK